MRFFRVLHSKGDDFLFVMALNCKAAFWITFNFLKFFCHDSHLLSSVDLCDNGINLCVDPTMFSPMQKY